MEARRKPWVAGVLGLFGIGLGQLYNGEWRKMAALLGAYAVLYAALVSIARLDRPYPALALILPFGVVLQVLAFVDGVRTARRRREDFVPRRYHHGAVYVALVVVAAVVQTIVHGWIRENVVQAFHIPSQSMFPTLIPGDHLFVDRTAAGRRPSRGDVVAYRVEPSHVFLHRVVALAGDTLAIDDKRLLRGGRPVEEPYAVFIDPRTQPATFDARDNLARFVVPAGHVFVMGDNRDNSNDSRFQGPVRMADVLGRATGIYWSWDPEHSRVRWGRLGRPANGGDAR